MNPLEITTSAPALVAVGVGVAVGARYIWDWIRDPDRPAKEAAADAEWREPVLPIQWVGPSSRVYPRSWSRLRTQPLLEGEPANEPWPWEKNDD